MVAIALLKIRVQNNLIWYAFQIRDHNHTLAIVIGLKVQLSLLLKIPNKR